jgi:ribosomal protein L9
MEETSKVKNLKVVSNQNEQVKANDLKPSYEDLERMVEAYRNQQNTFRDQAREMIAQMQEMQKVIVYRRLDYLFKVLDNKDLFDAETVSKVIDEIKDTLIVDEKEVKEEK